MSVLTLRIRFHCLEKVSLPALQRDKELTHRVCHQSRVLQGCHMPGSSPCHGLTLADKQGCAEQIALREEPMEGKHKH